MEMDSNKTITRASVLKNEDQLSSLYPIDALQQGKGAPFSPRAVM